MDIFVTGTDTDVGKTVITAGLAAVMQSLGYEISVYKPFQSGAIEGNKQLISPDLSFVKQIDNNIKTKYSYIMKAPTTPSVAAELEGIVIDKKKVLKDFGELKQTSDIVITEGAGGLMVPVNNEMLMCDIVKMLNLPVVLVINARAAAYSVAPMLWGFKHFAQKVKIAGVIFNQVSSASHYAFLKDACTDAGIEALGYIPFADELYIPSRHLGLTLTSKSSMNDVAEKISILIEKYVDIDKLISLCQAVFPCPYTLPYVSEEGINEVFQRKIRIAVARDEAFCFTYHENLKQLSKWGHITYFSPLRDNKLPAADLVYLPGGYPELYVRRLHHRKEMMQQLRTYAERGGKIFAECGGMMYLARTLTVKKGKIYDMAGILPIDCTIEHPSLNLGYREMKYKGVLLRGHEFHFSMTTSSDVLHSVAQLYDAYGSEVNTPLYRYKNVIAGYTHWYWGETNLMQLWE